MSDNGIPEFPRRNPEKPVSQLEFHPLADLFPMMDDEALAALTADIKEHGQHSSIVMHEGKILDGRNRYRACLEAKVEPRFETFAGDDPVAFVVSHNIHRRHLNESQRGMVAAKLANWALGMNQHTTGCANSRTLTIAETAQLLNVGKRTVNEAKAVLKSGTAEEIEAVEKGAVAASTVAHKIRANIPVEDRLKKNPDANAARHATQIANGKMWRTFKQALVNLTGLPLPADVVRIVRAQDQHNVTNEKLLPALQWLEGFANAWTSPSSDAQANSRGKNKSPRKAGKAPPAQEAEAGPLGDGGEQAIGNGHWLGENQPDAGDGSRSSGAQLVQPAD